MSWEQAREERGPGPIEAAVVATGASFLTFGPHSDVVWLDITSTIVGLLVFGTLIFSLWLHKETVP